MTSTATQRGREIFEQARQLHQAALERLAAGDIRDAAEKAWCAVKLATDALILVRTAVKPEQPSETATQLRWLSEADDDVRSRRMRGRYRYAQSSLHGDCFYDGDCDWDEHPPAHSER